MSLSEKASDLFLLEHCRHDVMTIWIVVSGCGTRCWHVSELPIFIEQAFHVLKVSDHQSTQLKSLDPLPFTFQPKPYIAWVSPKVFDHICDVDHPCSQTGCEFGNTRGCDAQGAKSGVDVDGRRNKLRVKNVCLMPNRMQGGKASIAPLFGTIFDQISTLRLVTHEHEYPRAESQKAGKERLVPLDPSQHYDVAEPVSECSKEASRDRIRAHASIEPVDCVTGKPKRQNQSGHWNPRLDRLPTHCGLNAALVSSGKSYLASIQRNLA